MENLREIANMCVGRAVSFGALAIMCVMVSFAFSPVAAFRAGAVFTLLMAAILFFKAQSAFRQQPKATEVWLYLDDKSRPTDPQSLHLFARTMREVYIRYGLHALVASLCFYAISIGFTLMGFKITFEG
jgi:hypothetical protein